MKHLKAIIKHERRQDWDLSDQLSRSLIRDKIFDAYYASWKRYKVLELLDCPPMYLLESTEKTIYNITPPLDQLQLKSNRDVALIVLVVTK